MEVFKFRDYKDYLKHEINSNNRRGYQAQMALAAGCKAAFLSQVLHTHVHLTPDHAVALCGFWNLSEVETDYFLALLELARSATPKLKAHVEQRLEKLRRSREDLKERFQRPEISDFHHQSRYYSAWIWGAVHMGTTIEALQNPSNLAKQLHVSVEDVMSILKGLEEMRLVARTLDGKWVATKNQLHIAKESPLNITNHLSWRQLAMDRVSRAQTQSAALHYCGVHSLSFEDFRKLKERFLENLDRTHTTIAQSPAEQLVCAVIDFFPISN